MLAVCLLARTQATIEFIIVKMGPKYVEPPAFSLDVSYAESNACMPLVFILSSGQDITAAIDEFAKKMGFDPMKGRLTSISLGQGQDVKAIKLIHDAKDRGTW